VFDEVLVYGGEVLCDHQAEYGLPMRPRYCGWVVGHPRPARREHGLLVVTAGGGGDGADVFALGLGLARALPTRRTILVAGPYASDPRTSGEQALSGRVELTRNVPGCADLFARADAVVQMAGYNSTLESLAAGIRPVLVPRRSPRREQAIRASRLTAMGLADTVDEGADADEVAWLLYRSRILADGQLAAAGIDLRGAHNAAAVLAELVPHAPRHLPAGSLAAPPGATRSNPLGIAM
jgi:predicted glycosyltransferase